MGGDSLAAAQAICRSLEASGVEYVFGLPGTQNVALYEALRNSALRLIVATSELSASMMANGYYRASGRPGVLLTIPGPGFAWAQPGIAEARLDSAALLHIAGLPARAPGNRHQLQAFDQSAVAAPLVKAIFSVEHPSEVADTLRHAYRQSLQGEPGPVLLHVAQELSGDLSPETARAVQPEASISPVGKDIVKETVSALVHAQRCVLLLGQGCHDAAESVLQLAERLRAPVVTTTSGRGVVAEDHPLSLGFEFSGHGADTLNALIESCDRVLAIGCKFSHNGSRGFRMRIPREKLIHVDASSEVLGANYPARILICSDARRFIEAVLPQLGTMDTPFTGFTDAEIARWRSRCEIEKSSDAVEPRIHGVSSGEPQAFFAALRRALPRESHLVTDSGQHQDLARRHFPTWCPRGLITPTNLQSMGFAVGAAIGARLARPGRPVVALMGDGGVAMSGLELLTAVREKLDLTVIVFADGAYGAIRNQQRAAYGHTSGTELAELDCEALAAAIGASYARLESDPENTLRDAMKRSGVTLLEVHVGDSLPMRWSQAKGVVKGLLRRVDRGTKDSRAG